jgi:DNA-binding NtrC family response regulator
VPDGVMTALQQYHWPGNVRELENVLERAMIGSAEGVLTLDDPLHEVAAAPAEDPAETLDALQRQHIEKVLRECGGRINGAGNAAVRLGIHPNTLRFRIKKLGVVLPQRPGANPPSAARPG